MSSQSHWIIGLPGRSMVKKISSLDAVPADHPPMWYCFEGCLDWVHRAKISRTRSDAHSQRYGDWFMQNMAKMSRPLIARAMPLPCAVTGTSVDDLLPSVFDRSIQKWRDRFQVCDTSHGRTLSNPKRLASRLSGTCLRTIQAEGSRTDHLDTV